MSKQEIMLQHVENWKQSGLTQSAYCESQNIKRPTFSYWLKISNKQESIPLDLLNVKLITLKNSINKPNQQSEPLSPQSYIKGLVVL